MEALMMLLYNLYKTRNVLDSLIAKRWANIPSINNLNGKLEVFLQNIHHAGFFT